MAIRTRPIRGTIVARIEGPPTAAQISLEPRAEIHRAGSRRDPDVSQVSGSITRRNVQAAAEGNGEVLEVAADAVAFVVNIQRGLGRPREMVAKCDVSLHPVADGLHLRPPRRQMSEQLPRQVSQHAVDFAIPAGQQEYQRLRRQVFDGNTGRVLVNRIGLAGVLNQRGVRQAQKYLAALVRGCTRFQSCSGILFGSALSVTPGRDRVREGPPRGKGVHSKPPQWYGVPRFQVRYRSLIG